MPGGYGVDEFMKKPEPPEPPDIVISTLNYDITIVKDFISTMQSKYDNINIINKKINDKMEDERLVERVLNYNGYRSSPANVTYYSYFLKPVNDKDAFKIHTALYMYIKQQLIGKTGGSRRRKTHSRRSKKSRRIRRR